MDNERILSLLASQREEILVRFGVKKLDIIGSAARDGRRSGSDVSILIEFEDAATFDKYMDLKGYLDDLLRTSVDRWVTLCPLKTRWIIIARGTPYEKRMLAEPLPQMTCFDSIESA